MHRAGPSPWENVRKERTTPSQRKICHGLMGHESNTSTAYLLGVSHAIKEKGSSKGHMKKRTEEVSAGGMRKPPPPVLREKPRTQEGEYSRAHGREELRTAFTYAVSRQTQQDSINCLNRSPKWTEGKVQHKGGGQEGERGEKLRRGGRNICPLPVSGLPAPWGGLSRRRPEKGEKY